MDERTRLDFTGPEIDGILKSPKILRSLFTSLLNNRMGKGSSNSYIGGI